MRENTRTARYVGKATLHWSWQRSRGEASEFVRHVERARRDVADTRWIGYIIALPYRPSDESRPTGQEVIRITELSYMSGIRARKQDLKTLRAYAKQEGLDVSDIVTEIIGNAVSGFALKVAPTKAPAKPERAAKRKGKKVKARKAPAKAGEPTPAPATDQAE